jgi:hypothetical protein
VLGEDEVEAALEDLRGAAFRAGMPERVLRGLELLEEAAGDGDVHAGELGVEQLHGIAGWRRSRQRYGGSHHDGSGWFIHVNHERSRFIRVNSQRRRLGRGGRERGPARVRAEHGRSRPDRGDDVADGDHLRRPERHRDRLRLAARESEEPG